jgi:hypothetical protein
MIGAVDRTSVTERVSITRAADRERRAPPAPPPGSWRRGAHVSPGRRRASSRVAEGEEALPLRLRQSGSSAAAACFARATRVSRSGTERPPASTSATRQ